MKIGFSSLVCPSWDLPTIVSQASELGYDGVELRGVRGELQLTRIPALRANPGSTRQMFAGANVELASLVSSCTFDSRQRVELARNRETLQEYIEMAAELRCPRVRIFLGDVQKGEARQSTLARIAEEPTTIAPSAAEHGVTVLIENSGDFAGSTDAWYICDYVAHPAIRVAWNPCTAMMLCERPTNSIPRLASRIGMFLVSDGRFDESGYMSGFEVPGEGNVELSRAIDLLKGVFYSGYLMFSWPKLWEPSLASPSDVLPRVQQFLRQRIDEKQAPLSAYKGDKNAPVYKTQPSGANARRT